MKSGIKMLMAIAAMIAAFLLIAIFGIGDDIKGVGKMRNGIHILGASLLFQITSIFEFALPMFFGLISGCYSSVCIASILWAMWESRRKGAGRRDGTDGI